MLAAMADAPHLAVGSSGEYEALRYLNLAGYTLLGRNVRLGRDEIDLIAYDPRDDVVVFVEVKTRSENHPDYPPSMNFTMKKRGRMLRAARAWVDKNGFEGGYRLDLICVADGQVLEHVRELILL